MQQLITLLGGHIMSKNVKAINGYKIRRFWQGKRKGIFIIFKVDDEFFTSTLKYYNVSEEKIARVKEILDEYTKINRGMTQICSTIPMVTFLKSIEEVIFENID